MTDSCCSPASTHDAASDSAAARSERPEARAAWAACLSCGRAGTAVTIDTMRYHLRRGSLRGLEPGDYRFCETRDCPVVYYASSPAATYLKAAVATRVGAKESHDPVPVCYCFSFSENDIVEDARRHGRSTIRDYIKAQVCAGSCECEVKNPSGRCCLGNVGRAIRKAAGAVEVYAAATVNGRVQQ